MAGHKREREVERARHERQQQRRVERSVKAKQRERIIASVVVAVVAVGGLAYVASVVRGDDDTSATPTASTSPTTEPSPTSSPDKTDTPSKLDCAKPNGKEPTGGSFDAPPDITLKPDTVYSVTLGTNCGDIGIEFDAAAAPENVASFIGLANAGYFDNTECHRLTTEGIFVLQCGDPAGDGTGGPGYELPDENLPADGPDNYPAGTVAMANAGAGTGGSQFFLVYKDTTLDPNYTILGTMTSGLGVVKGVAKQGTANGSPDGPPKQPVQILSAITAETTEVGG